MYNMVQRSQIKANRAAAGQAAEEAQRHAQRTQGEIYHLEARIEQLLTINEAMWQLICETTGLTEAHLAYRMYELDMADGERDGQKRTRATPCECGAMVNSKLDICQFCGAPAPERSFWDKL